MKTITVSELIKQLQHYADAKGPDTPVYMASDEEGNVFSSISERFSFDYEYDKLLLFPYESIDPEDLLIFDKENEQDV